MSPALLFDYLAVRLDPDRTEQVSMIVNWVFSDLGCNYRMNLSNCVLTTRADRQDHQADATVTLERSVLDRLILRELKVAEAVEHGLVAVAGDYEAGWLSLVGLMNRAFLGGADRGKPRVPSPESHARLRALGATPVLILPGWQRRRANIRSTSKKRGYGTPYTHHLAMMRTLRVQGDSNAHDRPWRVALEQGFFADEGLQVEYTEDNPKGIAGRCEDFSQRWKESQLVEGALEVYPVCEWGAIERVHTLGKGKIIAQDTTLRTGALMVRADSPYRSAADLRNRPIGVTWHAGTFYAVIEAMEAAGVPFGEIQLVHAADRLEALLSGEVEAAGLMEPLVSRAAAAGARLILPLEWRGGIVASDDVDPDTAARLVRALNRAVEWLRQDEARQRQQLLRDLNPELRATGLLPELVGADVYRADRFQRTAEWMIERGFLPGEVRYEDIVRT